MRQQSGETRILCVRLTAHLRRRLRAVAALLDATNAEVVERAMSLLERQVLGTTPPTKPEEHHSDDK